MTGRPFTKTLLHPKTEEQITAQRMILYTLTDQGTGGKYFMVRGVFNLYIYKIRKIRVTQTFVNWARIYSQV